MKWIEKKPSPCRERWYGDDAKPDEATEGCQKRAYTLAELANGSTPQKRGKQVPKEGQASRFVEEKGPNGPTKKTEREKKDAFRAALGILASGANSARMLREKLIKKGYSAAEARLAVEEAIAAGLLNERRLLEAYVHSLATRKYYGKQRIRLALLQKFDRETVERYFDEALEDIDFVSLAEKVAKRFSSRGRDYVIGKLRRDGYSVYEIRRALEALDLSNAEEADESAE